jgi:NADH-quinone oxidoreductase subunit K
VKALVPLHHILAVSVILFGLGAAGFIVRRNIITIFMCIELMLNAVNLAFIGFSRYLGNPNGQVIVFFVIVVAAAEAAVGLAIIIAVERNRATLTIDEIDSMKM